MLTINPKVNSSQSNYNNTNASFDRMSFQGCSFSSPNKKIGKQIVRLIKSKETQDIVILMHKCSDADAIGSALALKRIIQKTTGKIATIFIEKPIQEQFKFIDPHNEIKVFNEKLGPTRGTADKKIKQPDLVINVDTAKKILIDKNLYEKFVKNAKKTIDIDHHAKSEGTYADLTLVDTNKISASQLIMEFLKPFGINPKKVDSDITDPILMGIVGDSDQFKKFKPGIFEDTEKLTKTSNIGKIISFMNQKTPEEFMLSTEALSNTKFLHNRKVAYAIFDNKNRTNYPEKIMGMIISELSQIKGIKYYFGLIKNSADSNSEVVASIRSNDKSIRKSIEELGGGGRDYECGMRQGDTTAEKVRDSIMSKFKKLIA